MTEVGMIDRKQFILAASGLLADYQAPTTMRYL